MHYTSHSHLLQRIKIKMTFKDSYLSILFTVTKCLILEVQRTMYLHNDTPDKLALNGNNDVFFKRTWKEKKDKSLHGYFSILLDSGKSLRWHLKCCQNGAKFYSFCKSMSRCPKITACWPLKKWDSLSQPV